MHLPSAEAVLLRTQVWVISEQMVGCDSILVVILQRHSSAAWENVSEGACEQTVGVNKHHRLYLFHSARAVLLLSAQARVLSEQMVGADSTVSFISQRQTSAAFNCASEGAL